MNPATSRAGAGTLRPRLVYAASLLFLLALPPPARAAEPLKPWVPPGADSLVQQVAEARVRFRANQGDSIGGSNYRPYEIVGNAARRLLRAMGRENMIQARAVEAALDSLGLDTDVVLDPELPYFVFLMVRNPYQLEAKAVGFLYWFKGNDLRMQGAQFSGGLHPRARVWWTQNENAPYAWGVVDFSRRDGDMHFTLFRLAPTGNFWFLAQYQDSGYRIGESGAAQWVDINGDQQPELLAWMPGERDSLFEGCKDCPRPIAEMLFTEGHEGFTLQDLRIVPAPYSTFERFVRLLAEGNRSQAAHLLADPAAIDKAIAAGWSVQRPGAWKVEYVEAGTSWPSWMMVMFRGARRPHRYTVYFELVRGRWLIKDWVEREIAPPGATGKVPAPGPGGRPAGARDSVPGGRGK